MNFHTKISSNSLRPFFHFNILEKNPIKDPNKETLTVYNDEYRQYLSHTPVRYPYSYDSMLHWIESSLSYIKPAGHVLEIGSATPRDANFIRNQGFQVQCSDATPNFVKYMNSIGEPAILFNVLTDKLSQKYDMVFANAVFPHFTDKNISIALKNIHDILNDQGVVCFNVKQGDGEAWIHEKSISKRYTNYKQKNDIESLVIKKGFEVLASEQNCAGDPPSHTWIRIAARKL